MIMSVTVKCQCSECTILDQLCYQIDQLLNESTMGLKKSKAKSLSHGRPPLSKKASSALSSKATRNIIRKHHNLLKEQSQAARSGDLKKAETIAKEIEANGGLEKYQLASQTGQLDERGGDTSKILKSWLEEAGELPAQSEPSAANSTRNISVLEIGCLSPYNAISKCKGIDVIRIDLHSTDPAILEQDFMKRPLPCSDKERFDLISLSLVLNYVAEPSSRGDMLLRTTRFLRSMPILQPTERPNQQGYYPILFFTLPLPCVTNSRYMTEQHLENIMMSLGYELKFSKSTAKIYYSLWHFDQSRAQKKEFKKIEMAPGKGKNNFSIVIKQ
jgi:25S rRNA (adenine2142-N1)-methyltransferase